MAGGQGGSTFGRLRSLVAIPTVDQIDSLRIVAKHLEDAISLKGLREPLKRFDLRFTYDSTLPDRRPLNALLLFERNDLGKIINGELLLSISDGNLSLLLLHEIAHHYDVHCFEPYGAFSTYISEEFEHWRIVVFETMTFKAHAAMMVPQAGILSTNAIDEDGELYEFPHANTESYFTSIYGEAFARCFTQYFVRKWAQSPDSEIKQIVALFEIERNSPVARDYALYWSDSEMDLLDNVMAQILTPRERISA